MHFFRHIQAQFTPARVRRAVLVCVFGFLAAAVLWKGGKSLESTWLLTAIAWFCAVDMWHKNGSRPFRVSPLLWCVLLGFVLWTWVSYGVSSTANYGVDELLRTASFALIFLWSLRSLQEEEQHRFVGVLSVATLTACVIGVAVYLLQPVDRFVGTFFDARFHTDYWPNAWAEFLLLVWPILLWWLSTSVRSAWLRIAVSSVIFSSLLLSYSRGSILVFALQCAAWLLLYLWPLRGQFARMAPLLKRAVPIAVVAVTLFLIINTGRSAVYPVQSVSEKVTFTAAEGISSVSERKQFWQQALRLASAKPITGWGPYSFRFVQPRMQEHVLATSDHPHNVVLKFAAERGIPAAFLFAVFVGLILCSSAYTIVQRYQFDEAALLIGAIGVLGHNMLDYNLQFVGIALPFWIVLGLLARHVSIANFLLPIRIQRVGEVLVITAIMIIAVLEARFLLMSSIGRHAEAAGNSAAALHWYDSAQAQKFSRDMHLSRAHLYMQQDDRDAAAQAIVTYTNQNGEDARAWIISGDICMAEGDVLCATNAYQLAYNRYGWNDLTILRKLIEARLAYGGKEELAPYKDEIDTRMRAFAQAIVQNTHFIALSDDVEELQTIANIMADLYPDEEPRYIVLGARAIRNAEMERERLKSRPAGRLW